MNTLTLTATPTRLAERFAAIRAQSMKICEPLQIEDYVAQPAVFVSPPKWHLGHTTWFFENFVLAPHAPGYTLFNEQFNYCFNSYYESQGERVQRDHRGNLIRPPLQEVRQYRAHVDEHMRRFLEEHEPEAELREVIEVGLQHEQQHQELLTTDIKYILGNNPLQPAYLQEGFPPPSPEARPMQFLPVEEGIYHIGYEGDDFSWDNERAPHRVYLEDYHIADRLVTNAEFMEFMEDGGYRNFRHWLADGWEWVQKNGIEAPLYWKKKEGQWWQFTLFGLQKVDPHAPLTHISYYEADAFANWKGLRLPTEFEWEVACRIYGLDNKNKGRFLEDHLPHPTAQADAKDQQWLGNCWEWTGSAYLPYPRYPRFKGALGEYNGKFMINQMVLRGGSCATPRDHIRLSYRNFFHPHLQWLFNGFRLARHK